MVNDQKLFRSKDPMVISNNFIIVTTYCQQLIRFENKKSFAIPALYEGNTRDQWFLLTQWQHFVKRCLIVMPWYCYRYLYSTESNVLRSIHDMKEPKGSGRIEQYHDPAGHGGIPVANIDFFVVTMKTDINITWIIFDHEFNPGGESRNHHSWQKKQASFFLTC